MKLTMQAIIRWEQLNNKAFSQLNYSSEDDIISLFYVCTQNISEISLEEFKKDIPEESLTEMIKEFERQTFLSSQFQPPQTHDKNHSGDKTPVYIKEVIPMLVMHGLDVYFALYEMELCDLPVYLAAYDRKIKDKLTAQRLWTFYQLSPHLKKGSKPETFHPFHWETEKENVSETQTEENLKAFQAFLKNGLSTK